MSTTGKEYKLAIRIAGIIDKSFTTSLTAANSSLKRTVAAVDKDFTKLDKGFNSIVGVGKKCFSTIAAAASVAAVAIGAVVADCTKAASEFENQMSDVVKYVGGLADETGKISDALALDKNGNVLNGKTYAENYQEIKAALLDLSTQIPMTAEELTELAAAAGQSGYGIADLFQFDSDGNITGFLKDTAIMGTAMDISAEQAGQWAAKWENAFNMTHEEIMVLADQINYLGANSATTAAEIAQAVNDAASLGQIAGMDVSTTAALADAMLATGVSSDKVATSIKRTITNLSKGTSATKAMKDQWEELGFTAEGIAMAMQNDSIETLKEVFSAIGDLPDYKQVAALSTLFGQWAIEGDAKIVGNMQVFQDALDMVNDPGKYSGSMEREFIIKASTSENIDTMLGNAFQAMKINIGDSFLPVKKEISLGLIDFIGEITEKMTSFNDYLSGADGLSKWMKKAGTEFPTLQRKFKKFAQPVFSGIMDVGKWIVKHGNGIISVLVGIGAALAAYKIASTISHVVQAIMSLASLNPVTLGILAVVAAIGVLVGAFAAYKQHERDLVNQSLADHFGSIALSMKELQAVAEYIVSSESLGAVKKALEAFEDLDGFVATMNDAVSEIDKMNWKISIGMELTDDEQESYKQAIADYVEAAQEYALQGQYAVSLNLSAVFDTDDLEQNNIVDKINLFYADKYDELQNLGKQLNEAITEAFNDGLLEIDEVERIRQLRAQMAEIQNQLALGDYEAELSSITQDFSGADLTSDAFQNLQEEIMAAADTVSETYRESYKNAYSEANAAREAGYLSDEEYQAAIDQATSYRNSGIAETNLRAIQFQINTIMDTYSEEISQYQDAVDSVLAEMSDSFYDWDWQNRPVVMWDSILQDIYSAGPSKSDKQAIEQILEGMSEQIEELNSLLEEWDTLSPEIQTSLKETLNNLATLEGMTARRGDNISGWGTAGDIEGLYRDIVNRVENSNDYENIKNWVDQYYEELTGYSANIINVAAEANIRPAVEGMYAWSQEAIDEYYAQGFEATANVDILLNPQLQFEALSSNIPNYLSGPKIDSNADGGIIRNRELSWLAEKGPEAVIPLDGSRNAVSLWEKAGQLLGMGSAFDDFDLNGGGSTVTIEYNPTLKFYGEAPSKDDLVDALDISQDKFDSLMDRYLKTHSRVSFG